MNRFTLTPIASLVMIASMPLQAQTALEEVLVTAELRETSLLDASVSASVLTEDVIRQESAQHLQDILGLAPNVNFASGSSRARYFQIRGIGERSQFQEPLNPSVGLLLDGVDFSGIGTIGTMFDVEQVEVLRGPQGTLHGANALAGLINIRSNAPTEEFENRLEGTLADYETWALGFVSSGPISDSARYRFAIQQYASDGWTENDFLGRDDTQDRDELTARLRFNVDLGERHNLDLIGTWIDVDNGYDAFTLDNVRDTLSDQPGRDAQESRAISAKLRSGFEKLDSELLLTLADTETDYSYDEDWVYEGFHPFGYTSFDRYQRERDSYSLQWRLLSNESSRLFNGSTDWVVGLYYLDNQESLQRTYTYLDSDFTSQYDTKTLALFGQLDAQLSDRLTLVVGLRGENRETEYSDSNLVGFDPDKDLWGGRLALEYSVSEDGLLYGSISRGYRANGVNAEILASIEATDDPDIKDQLRTVQEYDEESLLNYELGFKSRFADGRLSLRTALFYMDRKDQQVKNSFIVRQPDGGTTFIDFTDNAAEGNNYGAELEMNWLPVDALSLWLNVGWLETEYEDYINADGEDLSGREQAQAPNYQYALGGRYTFDNGVYLQAGLEGKDGFYFSDRHDTRVDAYDLLNARVGFSNETWELALWGRNLTDEDVYVRGFGSFGNDPRKDYVTEPYYQFGEPRMVGVTASYSFN